MSWMWRKVKPKEVNIIKQRSLKAMAYTPKANLVKKLDIIFSKFIRLSALMPAGYIRCYTCGAFITYRQADCGHYVNREHMGTRYHEQNCKPQCHNCNRFSEGKKSAFALHLVKDYGPGILQELEEAREGNRFATVGLLEDLILQYKPKVKELEARHGTR